MCNAGSPFCDRCWRCGIGARTVEVINGCTRRLTYALRLLLQFVVVAAAQRAVAGVEWEGGAGHSRWTHAQ